MRQLTLAELNTVIPVVPLDMIRKPVPVVAVPAEPVEIIPNGESAVPVVQECLVLSLERQPSTQPVVVVPTEMEQVQVADLGLVVMALAQITRLQLPVQ
jgi:hypothetical protein